MYIKLSKKVKQLAILFFLLNIWDTVISYVGVSSGVVQEMNPIMEHVMSMGYWHFIVVKLIMGTFGAIWLYMGRNKKALVFICALYFLVVVSNTIQVFYRLMW